MAGKGDKYERKLRRMFRAAGYGAIRLAASGSGTDDDLPDLLIGRPGQLLAIEAKYRADRDGWHYAEKRERDQLLDFASTWGATQALWAARFPQDTSWYLTPAHTLSTTEKSVRWKYDVCVESWQPMELYGLRPHSEID